jgi:hypothetical protein
MQKIYKAALGILSSVILAAMPTRVSAQASVLGTELVNGSYTTYNLTDRGVFRQVRLQATSSASSGTRKWEFATGTASSTNYSTNWRPYSGPVSLAGYNQYIAPNTAFPATTATATYNTSFGGSSGFLPAVVSGRYYTVNITERSTGATPANEALSVLETSFNPVNISSVTQSPATGSVNAGNSVLVTAALAAAPATGEWVYLRYSTNASFSSSSVVQMFVRGSVARGMIPCFAAGTTVYYYTYTSSKTLSAIQADVSAFGESAHDLATLNLGNNGGANYSYTVGSSSSFSGTYLVPSACYPTINAMVNALNGGLISGPVNVYVAAGHQETAPATGINLTATGTASNPIQFMAFGNGAKPQIKAGTGTNSMSTSSATVDYIWALHGSDYISIDGINLADSNTSGAAQMEAGFIVFRTSNINASQNVSIRNSRIWFAAPVFSSGPSLFENGNKGIAFVPVANNAMTTTITPIAATGRCQNDTIESDTVINAYSGILFRSANDASVPYSFIDQDVVIGGNTTAKGNLVLGFAENGIKAYNINNVLVQHNRVDNNNQTGYTSIPASTGINGIWISGQGLNNANTSCLNNWVRVRNNVVATATVYGIRVLTDLGGNARMFVNGNTVDRCFNSTGSFLGIAATSFVRDGLQVIGNRITHSRTSSASGSFTGIIWGNSSGAAEKCYVRENIISDDSSAYQFTGISVTSSVNYLKGYEVSRNTIGGLNPADGITLSSNGTSSYGILNSVSAPWYQVDSNIIANILIAPGSSGTGSMYGYYDFGSPSNGTHFIRGNTIFGLYGPENSTSSVLIEGMRHGTASSNNLYLNGNTVKRIHGFGSIRGIYTGYGDYAEINDNTVDSLYTNRTSAVTSALGIDHSLSSGDSVFIMRNRISRVVTNSTSTSNSIATGLNFSVSSSTNWIFVGHNIISGISNLSAYGYGRGMAMGGYGNYTVWNNRIADISGPNNISTTAPSIVSAAGIEVAMTSTPGVPARLFNNTVHLNTSGTASSFSTAALFWTGSSGAVDVFNNIFYNTSTPGSSATAYTAGFWKTTTGITNTNYTDRSNNNLYYLNSTLNNKYVVYRNNANSIADSTMCLFTSRLTASPQRDANSVLGAVSFLSSNYTNSNFLLVNPSTATFAESGGRFINGFTTDVESQSRNSITPDIGADEFSGSVPSTSTATTTITVTHPATTAVSSGSRDVQILRSQIALSSLSSTAPVNISRLVFNTSGTTSATTSIDTAKLWFTAGNLNYSSPVLVGTVVGPNGRFAFNINQKISCAGSAYFWVTYGVRCPGSGTFVLDCQMDSVYIGSAGAAVAAGAPTGTRTITNVTGMSGTYTIGGTTPSYVSLAAAVTDLNTRGLSGSVVFDIRSGHTERTAAGGIVLNVNPVTCGATRPSSTNTLTIKRASATGAAPIIYAGVGTATTTAASPDAILKIVSEDYVTIDGISFRDTSLNTTGTTQAEWGIALLKRNAWDGCKRVVIQNCEVVLNRANNTSGSTRAGNGSVGVLVSNITLTSASSSPAVTLAVGTNDEIRISNNRITNCYVPIHWYGPDLATQFYAIKDLRDTIANNRLTNFGGSTVEANGIQMLNVDRYVISGNYIDNKANGGVDHLGTSGTFYGIRIGAGTSNTSTIENFSSGIIRNNTITWNHAPTASSTIPHGGIAIYAGGRNSTISVTGNSIVNSNFGANSAGTFYGVYALPLARNLIVSDNSIKNFNYASTKTFYGFWSSNAARYREFNRDTVLNINNTGSAGGTLYAIYHAYTSTTFTQFDSLTTMNNNVVRLVKQSPTTPGGYSFYGLYGSYQAYVNVEAASNTVSNISGLDFDYPIYLLNGNQVRIKDNLADSVSTNGTYGSATIYGMFSSNADSVLSSGNTVTRMFGNASSSTSMYGMVVQSCRYSEIYKNKIADLVAGGSSTGTVAGLLSSNSFEGLVHNNYVGDVKAPAMNSAGWLTGINLSGTAYHQAYYNTVYLNASSTGTNFNSTAVYLSTSTGRYLMNNNIFYNNSTPAGTGFAAAFIKAGTGLNTAAYLQQSGNNLYYTGSATNSVIYRNITDAVSDRTICDFLNRSVNQGGGIRDAYSLSSSLNFSSTTPTSTSYLHISTGTGTAVEAAGKPVAGITDDYDNDTRSTSTPDIGADEGSFTPLTPSITIADTVVQIAGGLSQGARNAPILRVEVALNGAVVPPNLTRMRFNTTGTTSTARDLDSAKLFFTGTSPVFSAGAPLFGSAIANPSGSMSFNGNLPLYCNDTFYFWLAYDLKCGNAGDSVDASAVDFTLAGTTYNISPSSPAGKRGISAPMSGTYSVGGSSPNYNTLADALADVNLKGLSGAVTLNVRAGHTEVAPAGGLQLYINSSCPGFRPSRNRQLLIQKSGTGANPVIYGFNGVATNTSPNPDGIFKIIGEDWVTIDGIDLEDSSTSTNPVTLMEWGYALLNSSGNDGCKRVVIKNASIKMSRRHRENAGAQVGGGGSKGILVANLLPTDNQPLVLTGRLGSHDSCRFDKLNINRVNTGIHIIGFNDAAPFRLLNQYDSVTNCRITGWGDTASVVAQQLGANGIRASETNHFYAANNYIDNTADGGYQNNGQTIGIAVFAANSTNSQNLQILNNTISLRQEGRNSAPVIAGIYSAAGGSSNRVIISNNKVWKSFSLGTLPGQFFGIYTVNKPAYLLIERDTIRDDTSRGTSMYGIYTGAAGNAVIANNLVQGLLQPVASSTQYAIFHSGTSDTLRIADNMIEGDSCRNAFFGIYSGTGLNATIARNTIRNINVGGSAGTYFYGLYLPFTGVNVSVRDNVMENMRSTYYQYGIYGPGATNVGTISNNRMDRFYSGGFSGTTLSYILYQPYTSSNEYYIDSNSITRDTIQNGYIYGIYAVAGARRMRMADNEISNSLITQTSTSTNYLLWMTGTTLNGEILRNRFINDSFNNLSGANYAIYHGSPYTGGVMRINENRLENSRFSGSVYGIYSVSSGRFLHIRDNVMSDNRHTSSAYWIYPATSSQRYRYITGNSIVNNVLNSATGGSIYGIYMTNTSTDTLNYVWGNTMRNVGARNTATTIYGIYNGASGGTQLTEVNNRNIFDNLYLTGSSSSSGGIYGVYLTNGLTGNSPRRFVDSNIVNSLTSQGVGPITGIYSNYATIGVDIKGNRIDSLISFGGTIRGIEVATIGVQNFNISRNTISDLQAYGISGSPVISGIRYAAPGGVAKLFCHNNRIANLNVPFNSSTAIRGIEISGGSSLDSLFLNYNTILLNASTTGANLSTSGIYLLTTPRVQMRSNLVVNNSRPSGTGLAVAYERSSSTLTTYLPGSDGNSFYAGTPGTANLIYRDGVNSAQTLVAYKTVVGTTRDANTVSVNPVFQSTFFQADSFLRLQTMNAANCALNKSGVPVYYVNTDFWNTTRDALRPDIGAHEFTPMPALTQQPSDTAACPGNTVFFAVGTAAPSLNYQWFFNGTALSNGGAYSGVNSDTLTVSGVTSAQAGLYSVKVWLCAGDSTTSRAANLSVATSSIAASGLLINPSDSVCPGAAVSLEVVGGTKGSGASWKWYTGSCGGTLVGTGDKISVSPTAQTIYFVRAEGSCNTTACASDTVFMRAVSAAATNIIAADTVCPGTSVTLSVSGGTLGSQASWKWYSGSCGGTAVGTGSSITVSPSATTRYYVRAEGACNTTACVDKNIRLLNGSTAATGIIASVDSICSGNSVTLSVNGGNLGSNAQWKWYSASCGGTAVGSGSSITVTPVATTTYYVRAEGSCNTTVCASKTIKVNQFSVLASGITGNDSVCNGSNITLAVNGGSLGGNARWRWYTSSCGGTLAGTGNSISIAPSAGTTYYVRAEGTCNTTACVSKFVKVNTLSVAATGITSTADSICNGSSVTLTRSGGTLGSNASWKWYSSSCGGTLLGTGNSISVSPSTTTTYYLRAEGTCNTTACVSRTIKVNALSVTATGITAAADSICIGNSVTLRPNGGTLGGNASWKWYVGNCGSTLVGTGSSLTVSPSSSTVYYLRAEGTCNTTACVNKQIRVNQPSTAATSITSSVDSICAGSSVTLNAGGGNLGSNANWYWYAGSCSGTPVATGARVFVSPTVTTTYYLRAEGTCNTTSCITKTIKVNGLSVVPSAALANIDSLCPGGSTTVRVSGGSLGGNATWKWYSGSCGGTALGTGTSLSVTPSATTTYYVRAEGTCNTTACAQVTIRRMTLSAAAASMTASADSICRGTSAVLRVNGGSLGNGAQWKWYSASCGGTSLGSGSSITVSPTTRTTYYVRAEGACNTTACVNKVINIRDTSVAATSISATLDTLLPAQSTKLKVVGGTLGRGARWYWYTGACGSGKAVHVGDSFTTSITQQTQFFVRAEGACSNTPCVSRTIFLRDSSLAATSIAAVSDTICKGKSITLTPVGGRLGFRSNWVWYTTSCGGTKIGTGNSITVAPSTNTSYFVRAEGSINTTACVFRTITVRDTSEPALSITAGRDSLCAGNNTMLSVNGGKLASGATWKWYSGSCGGTLVGSGTSVTVTPTVTTTYYVRAEGVCNNTICISKTIKVNTSSVAATAVTANRDSVCNGAQVTLALSGGSLGSNAVWKWYNNNCGGTSIHTGSSLTITPSASTTYYVRAEGTCNTTVCGQKAIKVNQPSVAATAISAPDSSCEGNSITLRVSGGSLGSNAQWNWYSDSCGKTLVGTGSSITVTPTASTTYFVRAEGSCNTTACVTRFVKVLKSSVAATAITGVDSICSGSSATLRVSGGSLGSNAQWKWYSSFCGGTLLGSGASLSISPVANTTYYLRAEGTCNNTACVTKTVLLSSGSLSASGIVASKDTTCGTSNITLTVSGGRLGSGAVWKWYSGSCGGTVVGTGSSVTVTPSATTTYFVRAEGLCGTTVCAQKTITMNTLSVAATGITATKDTSCVGEDVILSVSGGTLGTGASWKWYASICGGTSIGTGSSIKVAPSATTTYYVRAEGVCNTTICTGKSIIVNTFSTVATSVTASTNTTCGKTSVTLSVQGGSLGSDASWVWYSGSCGGTFVGTGSSVNVTPTVTSTYYVRAEGPCNTTACVNTTITVNSESTAPSAITTTFDSTCGGSNVTLTVQGGSLGTGASWKWYSGSCGGTALGSGTSITVAPVVGTTYFVRAEGTCNNTACASRFIKVNSASSAPTSVSSSLDSICPNGATVNLSVNGGSLGSNAQWVWYEGNCGGSSIGTGSVITVSPLAGTTYYVRAEGTCNTTSCANKFIKVNTESVSASSITASLDSVCAGSSTTLRVSGGSLGSNASWKWYTGACGSVLAGSGASITVTPSATTTYFVRAEGTCNNTVCVSKPVKVNRFSTAANGILASADSTCGTSSVTLSISGGSLGDNATWVWYNNTTSIGTGASITVTPTATTTYTVRAEGTCNNTSFVSRTIKVNTWSVAGSSIVVSKDSTCGTESVRLTVIGGTLGSNARWRWYTGTCGGTAIGTGVSIITTPSTTTTYFARAEGTCNITSCPPGKTVQVNRLSTAPVAVVSTQDSVCRGSAVQLSVAGGSLGSNARWVWYENACGTNKVGEGASISVKPGVTTTYYVRAEGTCNTTACVRKTIKVLVPSNAPTQATADVKSLCGAGLVNLKVHGGSLGSNAKWVWYEGACGTGSFVGEGESIQLNISTTTTFYVRAEGTCNNTSCESVTVEVSEFSSAPTLIAATADSVCKGGKVTLSISGGSLGTDASWKWYKDGCGLGASVGTGTSFTVNVDDPVTYYVRAEGKCNTTACLAKSIGIYTVSQNPVKVLSSADTSCGGAITLTVSGGKLGSGAQWSWYSGSCGGTYEGGGNSLTVTPAAQTTYYVRAEGACNTTVCAFKTLFTGSASTGPVSISVSNDTPCTGEPVTLTVNGGSLGQGAVWKWYHTSCGGSPQGTGTSITKVPNGSTVFFVRAEGPCNVTACVTKPVRLLMPSIAAGGIVTSTDTILNGASIRLSIFGGSRGDNARWVWYKDACGSGTPVGFGPSLLVTPSAITTYYVRAEGTCDTTACISRTVNVWGMGTNDPNAMAERVHLYPNPAAGAVNLTLDLGVQEETTVQLMDVQGRLVNTYQLSGRPGTYKLELGSISEGQYMLVVKSGNIRVVKRFTKVNP